MTLVQMASQDTSAITAEKSAITVMVVDDSAVIRGLITRMLEAERGICVISTAANGEHAIRELKRHPADVIVLDLEMPVMDGLTAIPGLLAVEPRAKILIASTLSTRNAEISLRCLQAGAADYLPKPTSNRSIIDGGDGGNDFRSELIRKVRSLGEPRSIQSKDRIAYPKPGAPVHLRSQSATPPEVLAIGSSTGGPQALLKLFRALGRDFALPVLLTQHMPASFTSILAGHITSQTGFACTEARNGEQVMPRHAYIAPGGIHMTVQRNAFGAIIKLDDGPPENFCRPAVDPMLRSIARCYGARALTVILTGMGSDGARGGREIVAAGGTVIAQDEETSVVWGMPGAAAAAGICSALMPIDQLAQWILKATIGPKT